MEEITTSKIGNVEIKHIPERYNFWECIDAGNWEPFTLQSCRDNVVPGKVMIDLGAWNGIVGIYSAKLGAITYSAEPDPWIYEHLVQNAAANKDLQDRIYTFNIAVSNRIGKTILTNVSDWGNSSSSLLNQGQPASSSTEVDVVTLEKFVEDNGIDPTDICLIKMDTEGSELAILTSSRDFLNKYRPTIHLSLHAIWFPDIEKNTKDIINVIYEMYRVYDGNKVEITPEGFLQRQLVPGSTDVVLLEGKNV